MKFSVVICVYGKDNSKYFQQAMDSIIQQTLLPDDIVIVVDGPVPLSIENIIKSYEVKKEVRVKRLQKNQGHGNARRIGLRLAKFDYVALMDADDISMADRFERQISIAEKHPEYSVIGGNIEEFDDITGNSLGKRIVPKTDYEIKKYLKSRCPFNQMTVLLKKADVEKAGGYLDWYLNEDYYLWIRMVLSGAIFYNCQAILVRVRGGNDMYKRRGGWKLFINESKLYWYMYKNKLISVSHCAYNIILRLLVQVLMPNSVRRIVYKKFARKNENSRKRI